MVVLHSLVSLTFVWDDSRQKAFEKLSFFINTIFIIIVLSFVASLFGIWKIVEAQTVWHFYQTFFLLAFASLHVDILSKAFGKEKYMDAVIEANYIFIAVVFLMLQAIVYIANPFITLGELYYRFLAAAAIIDGTLSVLTIIFYKLYLHNHPEIVIPVKKDHMSIWVIILLLPLIIFFFFFIIGAMSRAFM